MKQKRLTLFAGHYGSGKTNLAVNYAMALRAQGHEVMVADLDIVNPYFRTKDSAQELKAAGIGLISSDFANTNVDMPAIPSAAYGLFERRDVCGVIDVGGDDRGAYALGRFVPMIKDENDYEMLFVINQSRPLTTRVGAAIEVMREIEGACGLPFTAIVNNTNFGEETCEDDVRNSQVYAREIANRTGLPIKYTAVKENLYPALAEEIANLAPLRLQHKII